MNGTPDAASRPVLIFLHNMRTGGDTLRTILIRQFRIGEVVEVLGKHERVGEIPQLAELLAGQPRLIEGHIPFGLHGRIPTRSTYLTVLRQPVDRIVSLYHHVLEDPDHGLVVSGEIDISSLEAFVANESFSELDNGQTRRLSGLSPPIGQCSDEMLRRAKKNLRTHCAAFGLTERFDESVLLMKRTFGWDNVLYTRVNVSRRRPRPEEVPPGTIKLIERYNQLDLELYRYAEELFGQLVAAHNPDLERQLETFKRLKAQLADRPSVLAAGLPRGVRVGAPPAEAGDDAGVALRAAQAQALAREYELTREVFRLRRRGAQLEEKLAAQRRSTKALQRELEAIGQSDAVRPSIGAPPGDAGRPPATQLDLVGPAEQALDQLLGGSDAPIVAGPWLSEVGYELLYWIPFLNWAVERRPELRERLIVLSRGGAANWYRQVSDRYEDVFGYVDPEAYLDALRRAAAASNGKQKQRGLGTFEQGLVQRLKASLGLERAEVLSPSLMYGLFRQAFKQDAVQRMQLISRYRTLEAPDAGSLGVRLPDDYVAVRFYFNYSFPDTEDNRRFVAAVLRGLAEKTQVVLLNTGLQLDDHWDFETFDSSRLVRLAGAMTARNNLEVQSIAISRARAFYGTYGGLSYLPPFYGVPSVCFYSRPERFNQCHLELANRIYRDPGWGSFLALHAEQAPLVGLVGDQVGETGAFR